MHLTKKRERQKTVLILFVLCFAVWSGSVAFAVEDPDSLYRQGRFAEAEKAYGQSDMDHPKDFRYRYNRGCAAYQAGNYQGAAGAFSSVIKRTSDSAIRYKAAFNAGNAAFKQGDLDAAIARYKEAIAINPQVSEAKYNLELALRALEKQKKQEQKGSDQNEEKKKEGPSKSDRSKETQDSSSGDQKSDPLKQDRKKEQESSDHAAKDQPKGDDGEKQKREREAGKEPEDLKGDLRAQAPLPVGDAKEDMTDNGRASSMDRRKAEAMLDNIKEDPSRFSKYALPRPQEEGASGKDW